MSNIKMEGLRVERTWKRKCGEQGMGEIDRRTGKRKGLGKELEGERGMEKERERDGVKRSCFVCCGGRYLRRVLENQ